jgi:hypothetical protein
MAPKVHWSSYILSQKESTGPCNESVTSTPNSHLLIKRVLFFHKSSPQYPVRSQLNPLQIITY